MSDISILSHEYESNSTFSELLNDIVLEFKRRPKGELRYDAAQTRKVVEFLIGLMIGLNRKADIRGRSHRPVPREVVSRLEHTHSKAKEYYLQDLERLVDKLEQRKMLDKRDFLLLEELCDAADSTASASFRRLWRR